MTIAFLGFGEAARAFSGSLRTAGLSRIRAYDIAQSGPRRAEFQAAATLCDVTLLVDAKSVTAADIVISAVTADQSLIAAQSVAGGLAQGQTFIDINSVSPRRKQATAALINATGASYVDMAVMAPVFPRGHKTPCLVAGDPFPPTLGNLGFGLTEVPGGAGAATAIKMIRSLFVKGLEALTQQTMTAAQKAGCFEPVHASLAGSYPGLDWPEFATYQIERITTHGTRRAAEMQESAATLAELGLPEGAALAQAIAAVHDRIGGLAVDTHGDDLTTSVQRILTALADQEGTP